MITKSDVLIVALLAGSYSLAYSADLKLPPKSDVRAYLCGYNAGVEATLRSPTDPKSKEPKECERLAKAAKAILK